MAYQLPDLPYAHDALEPHIDAQTMEIHHGKHHAAYVTNLNAALDGHRVDGPPDRRRDREPRDPPRRQAGRRAEQRRRPREPHAVLGVALAERRRRAVRRARRGASRARSAPSTCSSNRWSTRASSGSARGWSWLVWDGTGLAVLSTPNQDSPRDGGQDPAARHRRLGARVLPQVPEPPSRVPRGDLECRCLGCDRRPLRDRPRLAAKDGGRTRLPSLSHAHAHDGRHGQARLGDRRTAA